jgi:hypothetical protein
MARNLCSFSENKRRSGCATAIQYIHKAAPNPSPAQKNLGWPTYPTKTKEQEESTNLAKSAGEALATWSDTKKACASRKAQVGRPSRVFRLRARP